MAGNGAQLLPACTYVPTSGPLRLYCVADRDCLTKLCTSSHSIHTLCHTAHLSWVNIWSSMRSGGGWVGKGSKPSYLAGHLGRKWIIRGCDTDHRQTARYIVNLTRSKEFEGNKNKHKPLECAGWFPATWRQKRRERRIWSGYKWCGWVRGLGGIIPVVNFEALVAISLKYHTILLPEQSFRRLAARLSYFLNF